MPDGDDRVGVFISSETLLELVRTPTYSTWQGEVGLFCCGQATPEAEVCKETEPSVVASPEQMQELLTAVSLRVGGAGIG
ncbi:CbrC family protein [Nonomuraea sp. SYSU D8015]|uniref:CbrC family protein n=1 Tax=Nonomuraea sp. SYSU D8015 TaxID=2593644 RepID=UPI001CB74FD8|nr:CbrC family protein [Nonomuraea sp. SYSU D8015]